MASRHIDCCYGSLEGNEEAWAQISPKAVNKDLEINQQIPFVGSSHQGRGDGGAVRAINGQWIEVVLYYT